MDLAGRPMYEIASKVGACFQNPNTQLSQVADTVFEEVAFGALNLGLDRLEVADRVWQATAQLGIEDLVQRDPRRLSGGQVQLVAVAGLLAMRPSYLVLDEPTSQLDPEGKALVVRALERLAAGGTGMLVAEHDTDMLARIADRVVLLNDGRVTLSGPASEVLANPDLDGQGVDRPARVRLEQALRDIGVHVELPV
jgi:energy-coupling factor transporter ATP-binding protein EcfA2